MRSVQHANYVDREHRSKLTTIDRQQNYPKHNKPAGHHNPDRTIAVVLCCVPNPEAAEHAADACRAHEERLVHALPRTADQVPAKER